MKEVTLACPNCLEKEFSWGVDGTVAGEIHGEIYHGAWSYDYQIQDTIELLTDGDSFRSVRCLNCLKFHAVDDLVEEGLEE